MGHVVKYFDMGPLADAHFCSHKFKKHGDVFVPVPINTELHLFNLLYPETTDHLAEMLFGYCLEYCFHDDLFGYFHRNLARVSPELFRCRKWFQAIISGFEDSQCSCCPDSLPQLPYEVLERVFGDRL
jgi:hypothetical protein